MFLKSLETRNKKLIEYAFSQNREETIYPNTYILDLDTIIENGKIMLEEAKSNQIDLFFMTKQIGRNPLICKKLVELGYKGAVVVDFQEALVMMKHNIPIAHAGHLVQIPNGMLEKLLNYGVGILTIFSIEKAIKVNDIAKNLGIIQEICFKFYGEEDFIYPGQNGGFPLEEVKDRIEQIQELSHIKLTTLTTFPCYLYHEKEEEVLPIKNLDTMKKAQLEAERIVGYPLKLNMPSCNQTMVLSNIAKSGGNSAEPGSSLVGMTPNNIANKAIEKPAMIYVSEISHNFKGHAYCYGGGAYHRGSMDSALVGKEYLSSQKVKLIQPSADNIDYYFELEEKCNVGDIALMLFRTQIFVTRSNVAVVSGLQTDNPKLEGIYSATGQRI